MKTRIMTDGRTELVAENGKYITEAGNMTAGDPTRTYCSKRYLIGSQSADDYRDADAAEKAAWEESLLPTR